MKVLRSAMIGVAAACLSGCVPLFGHFYAPDTSGVDGRVEGHDCGGRMGSWDTAELKYGLAILEVRPSGSGGFILSVQQPETSSLKAAWRDLRIDDPIGKAIASTVKIVHFSRAPMPGDKA